MLDRATNKLEKQKVDVSIYTSWVSGTFEYERMSLFDITRQLSRWYDVEFFYKNPEAKELVFTGDLEKYDDCEVALDIISMTTNVMFTIRDRAIIVQMK